MRVGPKSLSDISMDIGVYKKINHQYGTKYEVLRAIYLNQGDVQRKISEYYYNASGIYRRLCDYLAFLYRYDWYITPCMKLDLTSQVDKMKKKKKNKNHKDREDQILIKFTQALNYLDNSNIKKLFSDIALEVIKKGAYYGYMIDGTDSFYMQQLPIEFCRSRFMKNNMPVVEFNMRFLEKTFPNIEYREKILKVLPKDIQRGYHMYLNGDLQGDYPGDTPGWYVLDSDHAVKFSLDDEDTPPLIGAIPSIIDLDEAQDIDRKKTLQQLRKLIIQKLPLDKNGDLIFGIDEGREIHENTKSMLSNQVGVDVMTTFAEVDVANLQDRHTTSSMDDLKKVERTVYNNMGVSQNLFNTDGNIALEKSILNDEAMMKRLVYQFISLLNKVCRNFSTDACNFQADILETTIYNYKDLSKIYKEQTQIGYSKMLPQIALGHSQTSILAAAYFENNVLNLSEIMIPPMMSSTMSNKNGEINKQNPKDAPTTKKQGKINLEEKNVGRPEKEDDQKTEKTIMNKEAEG